MNLITKKIGLIKNNSILVLLSIFTGILVSIVAQYFIYFAKKIIVLLQNTNVESIFFYNFLDNQINLIPLLSCILAAVIICIIIKISKIERWYGPADTIYAAHLNSETLDVKKGFLSSAASFVSISGGASVGVYGPLVHFGGSLASYIRKFKFIPLIPHDILIGAGVAAAISAGFSSPIAGIIFAHEVVLRHFSMRAVTAISLASVSANLTAIEMNLMTPFLNYDYSQFNSSDSIPGLFVIGLFSALVAFIFMRTLLLTSKIAQLSGISFHLRPLIPGIMCGIAGIFIPQSIGLGSETILNVLTSMNSLYFLILILLLKIVLTSSCVGFGLFGGILSPALLLGACSGAIIYHIPFLGIDTSLMAIFAVSGMAAVSSSVIGAPLTAIILVLELTGSYEYAIATILPIGLSSLITYITFGSSFFDKQLLLRGIPISDGREKILMSETKIKNYAIENFTSFKIDIKIKDAIEIFKKEKTSEGYFINKNDEYVGKLKLIDIVNLNNEAFALEFKEKKHIIIDPGINLIETINILKKFVGESIPIVDFKKNILGIITESDVLTAYSNISDEIKNIEKH
jgi:chloride channel protein, CIC family